MIRRCSRIVNGRQCWRSEGHPPRKCDTNRPQVWCLECSQLRPAPGYGYCGEHGGLHAQKNQRSQPPGPFVRGDQREHEKLARIRRRAEVLREAGVL